jgi:DNA-binding CsgD family transcriptional regulator
MATFRRSRGRPASEGQFTPSEKRVLEFIRLGKTNSEIAHELRISVAGVKYHVTNLLGKAGVQDRAALAEWCGSGQGDRSDRRLSLGWPSIVAGGKLAMLGGGLAVFGIAALAIFQFADRGGDDDLELLPSPPDGYSSVAASELEALGMVDAGQILRPQAGSIPVFAGSVRQSVSVALLTGPAEMVMGNGEAWQFQGSNFVPANSRIPNWVALSGHAAGEPVAVQLWAEDMALSESTTIEVDDQGKRVVGTRQPGTPPELLVAATGADGLPVRAAIAQNGHLYVDPVPAPRTAVVDEWSGEFLDVTGAIRGEALFEPAAGLFRFTGCDTDSHRTCYVSVRSRTPLVAPINGVLTCPGKDVVEIQHGDVILQVMRVDTGYGSSPQFVCDAHTVAAGEGIGPPGVHWSYSAARASTGEPLSVGAAFDGTLYIGDFRPTAHCPCRSGS